jgi:acetyltransferase-like isoleucine patch superfamily enzyme
VAAAARRADRLGSILHDVRFFNLYRRGLAGLAIGEDCFIGDECLLDLAEGITLERQVTFAERVLVLTHTNVGYQDHPLQAHFPATAKPVVFEQGSFVGASATILPGTRIGARSFVAAGSVVTADVPPGRSSPGFRRASCARSPEAAA